MTDKMKGFVMGLLSGRVIGRGKAKEPVAYLYSGYRMPPLPEWNTETHPDAVISIYEKSTFPAKKARAILRIFPKLTVYGVGGSTSPAISMSGMWTSTIYLDDNYMPEEAEWPPFEEYTGILSGGTGMTEVVWTNVDIYNLDESLFMSKSDPVPVYE